MTTTAIGTKGNYLLSGGTLNAGQITNNHRLTQFGGSINATGDVTNNGKFEMTPNATFTQASGTFTNNDNAVMINNGIFDNATAETFINRGLYQGTGTFIGDFDNSFGTMAPGNSPGTMSVLGDYTLGGSGILEIEIGGFGAGDYDFLDIAGNTLLTGGIIKFLSWDSYDFSDIGYGETAELMFLQSNSITGFDSDYLVNNTDFSAFGSPTGFDFNVYQIGGGDSNPWSLWFSATHQSLDPDPVPVPVSGAFLLGSIGLALAGGMCKRKNLQNPAGVTQ